MGTMPMSAAKASSASNTFGSVSCVPITSAVLYFQIWLAKCRAMKRSGRPVASWIALGSSVDELVAKMVFSGASRSSLA